MEFGKGIRIKSKKAEHKSDFFWLMSQPLFTSLSLFSHGLFHTSDGFSYLNHHGTLDSLTEDITTEVVGPLERAGCMKGVGRAAATAVELRPAVLTFRFWVAVTLFKLALYLRFCDSIPNVSQAVIFIPDELVAWEEFAPWCDSEIFGSWTASGNSLLDARSFWKVKHVMVEGKAIAFFLSL